MGEQSHVDAMREAIRGDFARLERRRGRQELMRAPEPEAATEGEGVAPGEAPERLAERRGWLARHLFG